MSSTSSHKSVGRLLVAAMAGAAAAIAWLPVMSSPALAEGELVDDRAANASTPNFGALAGPRPLFQLPFPCGETWKLSTYAGHDDYDIDMTYTEGPSEGRAIVASYAGTVVRSGWDSGGGNYVRIDHGDGWQTLYLHMISTPPVSVGQLVRQGQHIGNVGNTGNSSDEHLHYEQLRDGAKVESYFNGAPSGITDDNRENSVTRTSYNGCQQSVSGTANVYGVLADGRLTFSTIDAASGNRTKTVVSDTTIGFTPKAMATLNFNTILMTDTGGNLYRIDVITNRDTLGYNPPVRIATGWTHQLLTYDANTHLFGIHNGDLRRYTVSATKPTAADISAGQLIGSGFYLNTLAATASNWLIGTTPAGRLHSYKLTSAGGWEGHTLATDHWYFDAFLSPGNGVYYGKTGGDGLYRYLDSNPFDDTGADIQSFPNDPVDTSGWTQTLLSVQPNTITKG